MKPHTCITSPDGIVVDRLAMDPASRAQVGAVPPVALDTDGVRLRAESPRVGTPRYDWRSPPRRRVPASSTVCARCWRGGPTRPLPRSNVATCGLHLPLRPALRVIVLVPG